MKTLFLESIAGIAGDMFAASFVDAGLVTQEELQTLCEQMQLPEVEIVTSKVHRAGMHATHLNVCFPKTDLHSHTHFLDLESCIKSATLPEKTKTLALRILNCLADAEAKCHGVLKQDVEFHELGMIDSLMDIVMAAYCITKCDVDFVTAAPIKLGRGLINTAHGTLPVPPPVSAILALGMKNVTLPLAILEENIELSTPTGLAILKALQPDFTSAWPEGKLMSQGCGAGTMELENYPNLFRICLIENAVNETLPYCHDTVIEISANFDDASPEQLAWATAKLFECGAVDVWQTSTTGKKGRVMIILSLLVPKQRWTECADFILKKTSTFGLRYKEYDRLMLARNFETRTTDKGTFQVKIGSDTQGIKIKEKFEFEELRHLWEQE